MKGTGLTIIAIFTAGIILAFGSVGGWHMTQMLLGSMGNMDFCPFSHGHGLCAMTLAEHIGSWQGFFDAALGTHQSLVSLALMFFVLFGALVAAFVLSGGSPPGIRFFGSTALRRRYHARIPLYSLENSFARGILHSRVFDVTSIL